MPLSMQVITSPRGVQILRTDSSGEVTAADARAVNDATQPGGKYRHLPILGVVRPGASFAPEARQVFAGAGAGATPDEKRYPVAVVVSSAPLRVMLSFVIRISGAAAHTRFFSSEPEALAWLDEESAKAA